MHATLFVYSATLACYRAAPLLAEQCGILACGFVLLKKEVDLHPSLRSGGCMTT